MISENVLRTMIRLIQTYLIATVVTAKVTEGIDDKEPALRGNLIERRRVGDLELIKLRSQVATGNQLEVSALHLDEVPAKIRTDGDGLLDLFLDTLRIQVTRNHCDSLLKADKSSTERLESVEHIGAARLTGLAKEAQDIDLSRKTGTLESGASNGMQFVVWKSCQHGGERLGCGA